jgi:uncharacterized membrane protein
MKANEHATVVCQICGDRKNLDEVVPGALVRDSIVETIRAEKPDWSPSGYICFSDLDRFRARYVENTLETERGELSALETEVVKSLKEQELLSENVNVEFEGKLTFGQRLADKVANFGGSWGFIILFGGIIAAWVTINSVLARWRPFDPFPFILLNLVLSCIAAVQAPVIMMSQNRQEAKDRLRSEHDYLVNLKAELEIRNLHEKVDQLVKHQWQRLLAIQQIQVEMMEELVRHTKQEEAG